MGHQRITKTLSPGSLGCSQVTESQFARLGIHSPHIINSSAEQKPFSLARALPRCTEPGSHSMRDSLLHRGRCLGKRAKPVVSCQDLHFCCMQQGASYILCVGEDTLCRQIPYEVKISPRWANSFCVNPVYRRKNSKSCSDKNFVLHIGALWCYSEDDAPLEYSRLIRLGMREEFLCTERVHISVERRILTA